MKQVLVRYSAVTLVAMFGQSLLAVQGQAATVPRFGIYSEVLKSAGQYENPYADCRADVLLTDSEGRTLRLPLFWDGGDDWRFRFSPEDVGVWKWEVESADAGLAGQAGTFECVASTLHGGLETDPEYPTHFRRRGGDRIWFMADTAWALVTDSAAEEHDRSAVERYLKARGAQGFNAVHMMLLNEAGWGNSGGPPWHSLAREQLNPAYFREADERIAFANAQGLTVGIALAWGEKTGKELYPWGRFPDLQARERYARYVAARYGAMDVYFLVSGEWHGEVRNRQSTEAEVRSEFFRLGQVLREADVHRRMIGIHPMTQHGSTREFNETPWMSFGDYQQNYSDLHGRILESLALHKPVVNSEYGYFLRSNNSAGVVDKHHSASVDDMRHATWDIVMAGGYVVTGFGSTYMGGHRHPTPFLPEDPRNEPWVRQLGLVKQLLTGLEWWKLTPQDGLLSCSQMRSRDRVLRMTVGDGQRTVNQAPAIVYWCLAELDRQYVVYLRGLTTPVELQLPSPADQFELELFNPRTGERSQLAETGSGQVIRIQSPDELDWVVLLRAR